VLTERSHPVLIEIGAVTSKPERYAKLVDDRRNCRKCAAVVNPSACAGGKYDNAAHIGPWSDWQGNLDADTMIIGQEWGGTDNYERQFGRDRDGDPTNGNLVTLMANIGVTLPPPSAMQGTTENGVFFFTNGVLCLRQGSATNRTDGEKGAQKNALSKDTFSNCARTFLRAQIELVEPRFVLILGLLAWNGLMEAFSLPPRSTLKEAFLLGHLPLNRSTIAFPLFHCGSKLHLNRPLHLQIDDWKKMKAIMDKHPLRPVTTL
jgi:uracil-DNA glycosylase